MNKARKNKGFSLIEVCIALIIIGIILGPMIMLYNAHVIRLKYANTEAKFEKITRSLREFIENNDRMPVPASFTAVEGEPAYGAEGSVTPPSCASSGWQTSTEGMCLSPNGLVLVGAVPFKALGLSPMDVLDSWAQRIVYTVALNQVDASTYVRGGNRVIEPVALSQRESPGTFQILPVVVDINAIPLVEMRYDTVLLSLGVEGRGAFSRDGALVAPCDTGLREGINCEFTHRYFLAVNPSEEGAARSFGNNDEYFDDLTRGYNYSPSVDWLQSEDVPDFVLGNGALIGINTDSPDPAYRVHVAGDVQVSNDVRSDNLCGNDDSDCFTPEIIAGDLPQMDCMQGMTPNTGRPVMHLGDQRLTCGTPDADGSPTIPTGPALPNTDRFIFPSGFSRTTCPTGELMAGINAAGNPICRPRI